MRRLPFVPARDPRHRAAALALYRALVRSARRVPLPEDLLLLHRPAGATPKQKHATAATAAATAVVPPRLGPIAETVRRRVAGNRAYTSLRLVYASMAAGYRFLEVLARARDVSSPENAQLVAHIRSAAQERDSDSHLAKQQRSLETAAASRSRIRRRAPFVPQPLPEPLIVNAAPPGYPPSYVSSSLPRPRASLDAASSLLPRRVPSLCSTADGQPFLRMAKPQPRALSRMVGRKDRIFQRSIYKIVEIDDELVPAAVLEDEWDGLVAEQMRREGVTALDVDIEAPGGEKTWHGNGATARSRAASAAAATSSYSWSVQLARLWWEWRVEKTWQDWTARGIALSRIVEEERALAELERDNGDNHNDNRAALPRRPKPDPPNTKTGRTTRDGGSNSSSNTTRPNVAEHPAPPLPLLSAITSRLGHGSAAQLDGKDPFLSAAWTTLVEAERPRLMKWLARGAAGRTNNGDAPASR